MAKSIKLGSSNIAIDKIKLGSSGVDKVYLGSTQIIPSCQFATNADLRAATLLWVTNNAQALATYGPIENWTFCSTLTDMSYVFGNSLSGISPFVNFNDDISSWDVSNVTNTSNMLSSIIFQSRY